MAITLTYKLELSSSAIDALLSNYATRVSTVSVGSTANTDIFTEDSGSGADVWFSSDSSGTSAIDARLLYWSDSASQFAFDVEIASVSASATTTIYLQVGSKPSGYGTDPYDANTVQVLEMMSDFNDSTSNARNATTNGGISAGAATGPDGVLPATVFDGTDDYVLLGDLTTPITADGTVGVWIKLDADAPSSGHSGLWHVGATGGSRAHYQFPTELIYDGSFVTARQASALDDTAFDHTVWHYLSVTSAPSTSWEMRRNGVSVHSTAGGTFSFPTVAYFGRSDGTHRYDGNASGLSIHNVARSAAWLKADYLLQGSSGDTYWTATDVTGGSSFQPAWAAGSNQIITAGAVA